MSVLPASAENIEKFADMISSGEAVAFPTETVYGLGVDAGNDEAPVGLDFDEEEWEVESDPEAYESDGPACECLPVRSAIKCNDTLQAALPGIVDFRNSDFEVTRKLAFS